MRGIRAGMPVLIGYFPIALTFGLLASEHLSLAQAVSMSAWVYAGASQFMALELIGAHSLAVETVAATFLMNFRHFIMNASLSQRLQRHPSPLTPLIAFWVTDETFSVAMTGSGRIDHRFMLGLQLVAYASWVAGTGLGFSVGTLIPVLLEESLYIALYALFAALLVPHLKRSIPVLITAGLSAGMNTLLQRTSLLKPGWSLVVAILAASMLGALLMGGDEGGEEEKT
jgi:4-azaleucine resistance transporter AzlC